MSLPKLAVKRRVTFFMVFIAVVAIGIVALLGLRMDLFPQMELPVIAVITQYRGVSPEDIEFLITRPIEETVATVENLDTLTSQSREGLSLVMANFAWGTNMDAAERNLRAKIDLIKGMRPSGADEPLIFKFDPTLMPVMGIGVSGEKSLAELRRIAEDEVAPRLERIVGVAAADVSGGEVREIQIRVDRERMSARGVTLAQLIDTIRRENVVIPAGTIEEGLFEYPIKILGEYTRIEQIADTVVSYSGNAPIYVKDVAYVVDGMGERREITRVNGTPAVTITIRRASGANTVDVSDRTLAQLPDIERSVGDIKLSIIFEQAEIIKESMANLFNTIILAVVLCAVVLFIFLRSLRSMVVVLISIPVSLVATFIAMNVAGVTMNIVSMGGLALGVGLFVDNSIVVLESIFRHREKGEPADQGAVIGASEVSTAITASTLTTICVFFPVIFIPGIAGQIFRDLVLTVTFSLLISLFVAISLVPLISSRILRLDVSRRMNFTRIFTTVIDRSIHSYSRMLDWCLGNRKKFLVFVGVLFFISMVILVRFVGVTFMPEMDTGSLSIQIKRPPGTRLAETDATLRQAENIIREYLVDIETMQTSVGAGAGFMALMGAGSHAGSIRLELVDRAKRTMSTREVETKLREVLPPALPEAEVGFGGGMQIGGLGTTAGANIEIYGHDLAMLQRVAYQVREKIEDVRGVADVEVDMEREGRPQLSLHYKRDRLYDFGLSTAYVSNIVSSAIQGTVVSRYREAGREYDILVRLREEDRLAIEDIERLSITTPRGAEVRLAEVANIEYTSTPLTIRRKDQQRIADVSFRAVGRPLGDVLVDVERGLTEVEFPADFRWAIGGSGEDMRQSLTWLIIALIVGMFLVYMVTASEFESLRDPFIMFLTIPLSLMGVAWMLFLTGTPLSIIAMVGVIMLVGIVINNSIVLIDYTSLLRLRGEAVLVATKEAGKARFRPVLMTALTTILAMIPLALQIGPGAENWAPMARSVIGGLVAGLFITLLVIPVIYSLFEESK
ncbi:efflux RND transporter permease subunit, partial [Candidatus Aerophobetes bacterium]|nr:efflux RND transporter permease subunit [Candidatus Aerophobetes bacterium]